MPATFRNNLVFANNKRQNIESRLFATGSGFRTGSVAISYNSFFNKFISDLPTLSNRVSPKYYASESIAASSTNNLIYQNNRTIYLQNFDIFIQETVSNTRQSETGSFSTLLKTKYYASESVAASSTTNLVYQNNRSIYLQNFDIFIQETVSNTRQSETGSFSTLLKTKYYASESVAASSTNNLIYQNNRSIYLQNFDIFVQEAPVSSSAPVVIQNETGSNVSILNTKYTLADAVSISATQIGYQSDRAIYLENNDILIKEFDTTLNTNETGSNNLLLFTNYYMSQSNATGSTLAYQNFKYIYFEDDSYLLTE